MHSVTNEAALKKKKKIRVKYTTKLVALQHCHCHCDSEYAAEESRPTVQLVSVTGLTALAG